MKRTCEIKIRKTFSETNSKIFNLKNGSFVELRFAYFRFKNNEKSEFLL